MTQRKRISVPKLVRRTHLFMALFLSPWIAMYALSTFAMHHRELLTGNERRIEPEYDVVRELAPYKLASSDANTSQIARTILSDVGLDGAHSVRGKLESGKLTIMRDRPIGSYRVTYDAAAESLIIERQRFGLSYFLEMLHRRRGFSHDYAANDLWALIVDAVIVAIIIWSLTGMWMWLGKSQTIKLGSAIALSGFVLFSVLLWIL